MRNIFNKPSLTADKGWTSSLGVGRRADNFSPQKLTILRNISQGLGLGLILWFDASIERIDLAQDRSR